MFQLHFCSLKTLFQDKKFKRLKKAQRHNAEESSGFSDEEEFVGSGNSGRTAEEKLKRSLFGDDEGINFVLISTIMSRLYSYCILERQLKIIDLFLINCIGALLEDIAEEEEQAEEEDDGEIGEEDEMADFIVDEEYDDEGTVVRYLLSFCLPICFVFTVFVCVF